MTSPQPSPIPWGGHPILTDFDVTPAGTPPMSPNLPKSPQLVVKEPDTPYDDDDCTFTKPLSPIPEPEALSFPNGNIILQSNEGDDFRVHLDILQSVSPSFDDEDGYSAIPLSPSTDIRMIRIGLDTRTLNLLLRFIYPSRTPPSIDSTERAITLMQATADLKIECAWIDNAITTYFSSDPHPLRAWAIATRFGYATARRDAVRRLFKTNDNFYNDVPLELEHVNARQFMELQRARVRAVDMARNIIHKVGWHCRGCTNPRTPVWGPSSPSRSSNPENSWKHLFLARISQLNPFSQDATSDATFELSTIRGGCHHCAESFSSPDAERARIDLRTQLAEILNNIE